MKFHGIDYAEWLAWKADKLVVERLKAAGRQAPWPVRTDSFAKTPWRHVY